MKKIILIASMLAVSGSVLAGAEPHWGYSGTDGPKHWAELSEEYAACSGKNQSPINLTNFIEADLPALSFNYSPTGIDVVNNGHTVMVNFQPGSTMIVDNTPYALKQYHVHSPSENHINGRSYPLEAHLVHTNKSGNIAVVAVMFDIGDRNPALASAGADMPYKTGNRVRFAQPVSAEDLLPTDRDYYRFNGSLTTPPCTEGVLWLMMKKPVTLSNQQLATFKKAIPEPDNRPIQPTNARMVLQ